MKYTGVKAIKEKSGLEYSVEHGANITEATEYIWKELVVVRDNLHISLLSIHVKSRLSQLFCLFATLAGMKTCTSLWLT